jgi:hypothetical protein
MRQLIFVICTGMTVAGLLYLAGLGLNNYWWWVLNIGLNGMANMFYSRRGKANEA